MTRHDAQALITVIDQALEQAPAPGTTIPSLLHVDVLLDLRLAVQECEVLAALDEDIGAGSRARSRERQRVG